MRSKVFLLVALGLVCLSSVRAQTVIDSESSLIFRSGSAVAEIVIENPADEFNGSVSLELLDPESRIKAKASKRLRVDRGKNSYRFDLPVDDGLLTAAAETIT